MRPFFVLTARQCFAGPFETLPPIVYDNWFMAVKEGMPIWTQSRDLQAMIVIPSILGLFGSMVGMSRAICSEHRVAWASLLAMQIVAFLVSLDLMRAMSYAHLLALPGNAVLLAALLGAVQRLRTMPLRVALSAGTVVLTPFGASAAMAAVIDPHAPPAQSDAVADRFRCTTYESLRGLDALPASLLFTPLDVGAHMLVYSASQRRRDGPPSQHRGHEGRDLGLAAPTPDDARAIVTSTGARYVVFCKGENEVVKYARRNPRSLIAALLKGQNPDWLVPGRCARANP